MEQIPQILSHFWPNLSEATNELSQTLQGAQCKVIDYDDEMMLLMMVNDDRGGPVERKSIRKITGNFSGINKPGPQLPQP